MALFDRRGGADGGQMARLMVSECRLPVNQPAGGQRGAGPTPQFPTTTTLSGTTTVSPRARELQLERFRAWLRELHGARPEHRRAELRCRPGTSGATRQHHRRRGGDGST